MDAKKGKGTGFEHQPVLYDEVMAALQIRPDGIYVDGTLGGAGHAGGIARQLGETGWLIGIDRDKAALASAKERLKDVVCRVSLIHSEFSRIENILDDLEIDNIDGALLDLGVSSPQLDQPDRGFSYMQDGPLDMRMNRDDRLTALEVVNNYSEAELADIIRRYGEERWAVRIAAFIVKARQQKPLERTFELVEVVKQAIPAKARREGPHPAKRTFQALRIEVNQELTELSQALDRYIDRLRPGGRLAVITFHSLEDRIAKDCFRNRANPCICPRHLPRCVCGKTADIRGDTLKAIQPKSEEIGSNPRARSAKLRYIEKR